MSKLRELAESKREQEQALLEAERQLADMRVDEKRLKIAFRKAKQMLKSGTLKNRKAIVEQYVKRVIMYKEKI